MHASVFIGQVEALKIYVVKAMGTACLLVCLVGQSEE